MFSLDVAIALVTCGDVECRATGSRVICDPPPTDTDEDYIVYVSPDENGDNAEVWGQLVALGFTQDVGIDVDTGEAREYDDETGQNASMFKSFRKDKLNIILTFDKNFYETFCQATDFCKRHNVMEKPMRIAFFRAFLYDEDWPSETITDPREEPEEAVTLTDVRNAVLFQGALETPQNILPTTAFIEGVNRVAANYTTGDAFDPLDIHNQLVTGLAVDGLRVGAHVSRVAGVWRLRASSDEGYQEGIVVRMLSPNRVEVMVSGDARTRATLNAARDFANIGLRMDNPVTFQFNTDGVSGEPMPAQDVAIPPPPPAPVADLSLSVPGRNGQWVNVGEIVNRSPAATSTIAIEPITNANFAAGTIRGQNNVERVIRMAQSMTNPDINSITEYFRLQTNNIREANEAALEVMARLLRMFSDLVDNFVNANIPAYVARVLCLRIAQRCGHVNFRIVGIERDATSYVVRYIENAERFTVTYDLQRTNQRARSLGAFLNEISAETHAMNVRVLENLGFRREFANGIASRFNGMDRSFLITRIDHDIAYEALNIRGRAFNGMWKNFMVTRLDFEHNSNGTSWREIPGAVERFNRAAELGTNRTRTRSRYDIREAQDRLNEITRFTRSQWAEENEMAPLPPPPPQINLRSFYIENSASMGVAHAEFEQSLGGPASQQRRVLTIRSRQDEFIGDGREFVIGGWRIPSSWIANAEANHQTGVATLTLHNGDEIRYQCARNDRIETGDGRTVTFLR